MEPEFNTDLSELIGIAVGEASMQWEPRPIGVFDSTNAEKVAIKLQADIFNLIKKHHNHIVKNINPITPEASE